MRSYSALASIALLAFSAILADQAQAQKGSNTEASRDDHPTGFHTSVIHEGITINVAIQPPLDADPGAALLAGHQAVFRLALSDSATGTALRGLHPLLWIGQRMEAGPNSCKTRIQSYLGGGLFVPRPDLSLDSYNLVILNSDSSVEVAAPHFESGKSLLLARVPLPGPGEDWVFAEQRSHLFVSVPTADRVAMIDTNSWRLSVLTKIPQPARVAIQPDGRNVWVAYGEVGNSSADSGVAALSAQSGKELAQLRTGRGGHEIAFSSDSRYVFVTNRSDNTVSLIDVAALRKVKDWRVPAPVSVGFSSLAGLAYVTAENGTIFGIDAEKNAITSQLSLDRGLGRILFFGDSRLGIVLNPEIGRIYIFDASRNRVVQTGLVSAKPDRIVLSDQFAYLQSLDYDTVTLLPLPQLGTVDTPIPMIELPSGERQHRSEVEITLANSIAPVPGENSIVIANSADRSVHYYMEGMAAPMGTYSNHGGEPRAVIAMDSSLRETYPGIYEASAKLPAAGDYELAIFLDSPRIGQCMHVTFSAPGDVNSAPRQGP